MKTGCRVPSCLETVIGCRGALREWPSSGTKKIRADFAQSSDLLHGYADVRSRRLSFMICCLPSFRQIGVGEMFGFGQPMPFAAVPLWRGHRESNARDRGAATHSACKYPARTAFPPLRKLAPGRNLLAGGSGVPLATSVLQPATTL